MIACGILSLDTRPVQLRKYSRRTNSKQVKGMVYQKTIHTEGKIAKKILNIYLLKDSQYIYLEV